MAAGDGCTPLYKASGNGHSGMVQALLAAGAAVNQAWTDGCTPLYIASQEGHPETVAVLLAKGAGVNQAMNT